MPKHRIIDDMELKSKKCWPKYRRQTIYSLSSIKSEVFGSIKYDSTSNTKIFGSIKYDSSSNTKIFSAGKVF